MHVDWERLIEIAQGEVSQIIKDLPPALREKTVGIPVTFEPKPAASWIEDGIEADCLGLFVGPDYTEEQHTSVPLPAQIILFLENLWEFAEANDSIYREELRRTYLHELGHFLGLNEDDLLDRDLD